MISTFQELWRYRSLVLALVGRHLSMRYRGSVLGFLWSFLNPLCLMAVYTLVFKYYIRFDVENYAIFLFCGLLPWLWNASSIIEGATSVVSSGHLITKSMFPAQILPTVAVITGMVHFLLSLPMLLIFMLIAGVDLPLTALFLPVLVAFQFFFLLGLALMLGALNVLFRDVQHLAGNLLTFLFFLCPILYPVTQVPEAYRFTMDYNPLAALTVSYQNILLEGHLPGIFPLVVLAVSLFASLAVGSFVFERYKESFAEKL